MNNKPVSKYKAITNTKIEPTVVSYRENDRMEKTLTDKELIIFLMDEIDKASDWLIEGQTHMATGVLGECHAEIRKHLSK